MLPRLHEQYPLLGLNSFGVEARARWFCRVRGAEDLAALAADPRLTGLPRLVIGGGSNLLLTQPRFLPRLPPDFVHVERRIRAALLSGNERLAQGFELLLHW